MSSIIAGGYSLDDNFLFNYIDNCQNGFNKLDRALRIKVVKNHNEF